MPIYGLQVCIIIHFAFDNRNLSECIIRSFTWGCACIASWSNIRCSCGCFRVPWRETGCFSITPALTGMRRKSYNLITTLCSHQPTALDSSHYTRISYRRSNSNGRLQWCKIILRPCRICNGNEVRCLS